MTALPSIVAGLFVYAAIIQGVTHERSGFAAGIAITVMMLPIIIRSADVVLRLVPDNLREASYALGTSRWRTVWHVVLPTARSGLVTSVILGTARGIGETSPVLLTSGITAAMNTNPLVGPDDLAAAAGVRLRPLSRAHHGRPRLRHGRRPAGPGAHPVHDRPRPRRTRSRRPLQPPAPGHAAPRPSVTSSASPPAPAEPPTSSSKARRAHAPAPARPQPDRESA